MAFEIPSEHYDADLHAVPFTVGQDFIEKQNAYREDGFFVSFNETHLLVIKPLRDMAGRFDIPETPAEMRV